MYISRNYLGKGSSLGLSMCYEKDIVAVFAYDVELLQKMKSLLMQG